MARYDLHHESCKQALINDGWTITHDPFTIQFGQGTNLYADLGAEKLIGATKQNKAIVVEVKTFGGISFVTELQKAVGQYVIYRDLLEETEPARILYLAITESVYKNLFLHAGTQLIIQKQKINLIVFQEDTREVVKWIS